MDASEFTVDPASKRFVARGGYGIVETMMIKYKDQDEQLKVACKTIPFDATSKGNSDPQKDVEREWEIISKLNHENIVQSLYFEQGDQEAKIYMEYCEGGSLDDYLRREGEPPGERSEKLIWKVIMQLSSALSYCHEGLWIVSPTDSNQSTEPIDWNTSKKILHRDIKPGNVFLTTKSIDTSTIKLGDFGLGAILRPGGAPPSSYLGTPKYTAPEITRSTDADIKWTEKCDVFSLGCTIYTLCKNKAPFPYRMESENEKPAESLSDSFSSALEELTMQCLSFQPESRPDASHIFREAADQLESLPNTKFVGHKIGQLLAGASIAATSWPGWHFRVYFQDSSGGVREARHDAGTWAGGDARSSVFKAKMFTPLAVISHRDGEEIRVFSLTEENLVQEYCYSASHGRWKPGSLNELAIEAASNSALTAVWMENSSIRLYYQEPLSNALQEYIYCPAPKRPSKLSKFASCLCRPKSSSPAYHWQKGATLRCDALGGTSLAVVTWSQSSLRIYFQNTETELREHASDDGGNAWYAGHAHIGIGAMPKRTPISAMAWLNGSSGIQIRVYWHDKARHLVQLMWSGGWHPVHDLGLMGFTKLSAVQWDGGRNIRIYFQASDQAIREKCFSNGQWYGGSRVDQIADV